MNTVDSSNVISVNFTQSNKLAIARQQGIHGAWLGAKNPYVVGGALWTEFNYGRKMSARFGPLGMQDANGVINWNPIDFSRNKG